MGAKSKISGYVLIVCSVVGAIAGGTLVAICMALALAGGIVAIIGIDGDKLMNSRGVDAKNNIV